MLNRYLIGLFLIFMQVAPALSNGQGYSTVPMPGFFNSNNLRYKQALDTENGRVWIGTRDLGVLVWSNSTWTFWDQSNGCPDNNITSIDLLATGESWVGTDTGGIGYFDGFGWQTFTQWNSNIPATRVNCIQKIGNDVWAGTEHGLLRYDGISWNQFNVSNSQIPSDTVLSIAADGTGGIYVGTQQGLVHFANGIWDEYWINTISNVVSDLCILPTGKKYCISGNDVYTYENTTWINTAQFADLTILGEVFSGASSIIATPQGTPLFNGPQGRVYEVVQNKTNVFYFPILRNIGILAESLLDTDEITGEIWMVNIRATNIIESELFLTDFSTYNGLGRGFTPLNARYLNANNIEAGITNRGEMHYGFNNASSYRSPKTQAASTTFISNLWISGLDSIANIHGAFQRYRVSDHGDYFPGPLNTNAGTIDSTTAWEFDRIWAVTKYDISEFQWHFAQGNVQNGTWQPSLDIVEWPAQGNTSFVGELAPYVDVNINGTYDPLIGGDYPFIEGDQELFWVFNDQLAAHSETNTLPMGIQVNATARAYFCANPEDSIALVNDITLYEFDIINRSGSNYTNVMISWAQDLDLGNWQDDFVGCDTMNNAGFGYNGDPIDEFISTPSFGNYPPICANIILEGPLAPAGDMIDNDHDNSIDEPGEQILLSGFHTYATASVGPDGPSYTGVDHFRYQRGWWKDSTRVTFGGSAYGGTIPTNYIYPGNPTDSLQWNESSAGQTPYDRFMILNCGPTTLNAGDTIHFAVAMATIVDSTQTFGTPQWYDQLPQASAKIRNWNTNSAWPGCAPLFDETEEYNNHSIDFTLFPNPTSETFELRWSGEDFTALTIRDVAGRTVQTETLGRTQAATISVLSLPPGIYFVTLQTGDRFTTKKLIRN